MEMNIEDTGCIEVLDRLKRGLAGYISYLAACEMNKAFNEYILYEPILRILTARGYAVECEYICPGEEHRTGRGDKKRIDFHVTGNGLSFAIEVKWSKKKSISIRDESKKLHEYLDHFYGSKAFLCVFGRKSHLQTILLSGFAEGTAVIQIGEAKFADFGKTKYGCKVYELKNVTA